MATIAEALGGNPGETIMEALGGHNGETIADVVLDKAEKESSNAAPTVTPAQSEGE